MLTRKGVKGFFLAVLTVDAFVVVASTLVALVLGAFDRTSIGFLILLTGAVLLLSGALTAGAMPMMGGGFGGVTSGPMDDGLRYTNVLHAELLLQEELRDPERIPGLRARQRLAFVTLVSGVSLFVISLFVM